MDNKYSVWQKIDLHIHTDLSKKTKNDDYQGTFSVQTLHEKLTEQEVEIFSLTDHNIINLAAYEEYYKKFQSESDPLLLLGIELDIERKEKTYHSLLIFNCNNYDCAKDINDRLETTFKAKGLSLTERKLTIDDITDIFPEDDFFFIPHAGNTSSIVDGYRDNVEEAQKMLILLQSPLEKVSEKKRQIYNEKFDTVLQKAFKNKDDYAYIEFSDNHNIQKYPCKHKGVSGDHEFYYIKGSKNYETLRLAFIDPKSRIKSSEEFRDIIQERNYIETLQFNSNFCIDDSTLEFSPHLNVIIGGRSSGKSLLLDILSRSIDQLIKKTKYDSIEEDLESTIKSKFDEAPKTITSIETSIIHINQGDIVNFFEENKLEDLAKKTGKIEEYNDAKAEFTNKKIELTSLIDDFITKYKEAFDLDISKKVIIHSHTIKHYLSNEFLFTVDINSIEDLHKQQSTLNEISELLSFLIDYVDNMNKSTYFTFSSEERPIIKSFDDLINKKKEEVSKEISIRILIDSFLEKVNDNIKASNSNLTQEGQAKAQAKEFITGKISDTKILFKTLHNFKCITETLETYDFLHKEEIELDSCSKLCLEVQSNDKIRDLIIDGIKDPDNQSLYICLLKLLYGDCAVKYYGDNIPESMRKKTKKQLEDVFNHFDNPSDFLEYSDSSNSKNNSPGYNSEKYLQEILDNPSSNIIIIDQPEDNLGNKFISDELVNLIRELKFKKQMFLVTHNPAIVVYGDAESIICAQNDDNRISYSQIKLEDVSSQKEICSILDGGEYIFDNRARKYNIQKLLIKEE
jgi:predicted ATP-dependent endonuclease of OLD family